MQIYGVFDASGEPTAFYNDDLHDSADIPKTAIEITEQDWQSLLSGGFHYDAGTGAIIANPAPSQSELLQTAKTNKMAKIAFSFNQAAASGNCQVTTSGKTWLIDCRRSADKNDLQNIEGLIGFLSASGTADDFVLPGAGHGMEGIKGADNQWHACTFGELKMNVHLAMLQFGQSLYDKKWGYEAQITAATTIDAVNAIAWS